MRFLFLDFDGVLNSHDWLKRRPSKEEFESIHGEFGFAPDNWRWAIRSIDPDAVLRLNRIVTATKARVVVSSTWRTMYALSKLERILRWHGFEHHLMGATPDGWHMRAADGTGRHTRRGDEIMAWLDLFDEDDWSGNDIVILDDDSDMEPLMSRLFKTQYDFGLRDEDVDTIIAMYNPVDQVAIGEADTDVQPL